MHPNHVSNMILKARRIANVLEASEIPIDWLEVIDSDGWGTIAMFAKESPISIQTQRAVIEVLKDRENNRDKVEHNE